MTDSKVQGAAPSTNGESDGKELAPKDAAVEYLTTSEVAREANRSVFDEATLRRVETVDDVDELLAAAGVAVDSFDEYGSGFEVLSDKDRLIGVPFSIVEWRFSEGKYPGDGFVSAAVVTTHGERFIINDGSVGIRNQLLKVRDARLAAGRGMAQQGLRVPRGLRRSDYPYRTTNDKGETVETPASTYYLS